MPLYEYQCDACAHRFERIQKFSDPPPAACPQCGGAVQKLLSSPAIQFKGSGFYLTDYGRGTTSKTEGASAKGGNTEGGAKGGSEGGSESGSAGKSDGASSESGKSTKSDSSSGTGASAAAKTTTESSSAKATPAKSD